MRTGSKKARVGVSGVELCYHTKPEYSKLNEIQRKELREWHKGLTDKTKSMFHKKSVSAVTKIFTKEEAAKIVEVSVV